MNLFDLATQDTPDDGQNATVRQPLNFDSLQPQPRVAGRPKYDGAFDAAAKEYGISPDLLRGVAFAESRFRDDVISGRVLSSTGASGLMQFMPDTAKEYGINPLDPVESIFGAAQYLRKSLDRFGGDESKAVASYNAGPNRKAFESEDWKGRMPKETQTYIETVMGFADGQKAKRGPGSRVELPEGVTPSQAGAGRGVVNPPMASELPDQKPTAAKTDRSWREAASDTGKSVAQGLLDVAGLPGIAYSAATGDYGNPYSSAIRGTQEVLDEQKSPGLRERQRQMQESLSKAEGWREKFAVGGAEILSSPALLGDTLARSLPGMVAGAVAGRVAGAGAEALGAGAIRLAPTIASPMAAAGLKVASAAPTLAGGTAVGTSAAIQGSSVASEVYTELMKLPVAAFSVEPEFASLVKQHGENQAKSILASASANRALSVATAASVASMKLIPGGSAIEKMFLPASLKGAARESAKATSTNLLTKPLTQGMAGGIGAKAAELTIQGLKTGSLESFSEAVEEASGAGAKGLELSRAGQAVNLPEMIGESAGQGAAVGLTMGAIAGAKSVPRVQDQPTTPTTPVTPAAAQPAALNIPIVPVSTPSPAAEQAANNIADILGKKNPAVQSESAQAAPESVATEDSNVSNPVADGRLDSAGASSGSVVDDGSVSPRGILDNGTGQPSVRVASELAASGVENTAMGDAGLQSDPVATMNPSGTLTVKGDPVAIRQTLQDGGITSILSTPSGVTVGVSQAEKALALVQDVSPAPAKLGNAQDALTKAPSTKNDGTTGQSTAKSEYQGRDSTPLSEGSQIFKTSKEAAAVRKLSGDYRTVRVEGGYALAEKTPAQLAAQQAAARRMALPNTSPAGQPIPAHAFVADQGGLRTDTRADMNMQGNTRIGNRFLFAGPGKGLSIEQATEKLIEDGYLPEDAGHDQARNLIKRSLSNPQYTPEGVERMAEKDAQKREAAYHAEQEALAKAQDVEDEALDQTIAAFDQAMLDIPQGLSQSDMNIDEALIVAGYSQEEIDNGNEQQRNQDAVATVDKAAVKATSGQSTPDTGGRESTPGSDSRSGSQGKGLTSPTPTDILSQQDRKTAGDKAEATQRKADEATSTKERERKDIAVASQAAADTFELGGDAVTNLTGQKDIFGDGVMQAKSSVDQTDTPAFKQWFGDSKVVDDDGKPLVVYHGTQSAPTTFKESRMGAASTIFGSYEVNRSGIFAAESKELAEEYAGQGEKPTNQTIMPLYMALQNPLDTVDGYYTDEVWQKIEKAAEDIGAENPYRVARHIGDLWDRGELWQLFDGDNGLGAVSNVRLLKTAGFDGVRILERSEGDVQNTAAWVAFNPSHVKSAIGNNGNFDPFNNSILQARGMPKSLSVETAQAAADKITAKWKNAPPIKVVATTQDLPGYLEIEGNPRGVYANGRIWLITGNNTNAAMLGSTLAHEVIAHHGLRDVLGRDRWNQLMKNINLAAKTGNKAIKGHQDAVRKLYAGDGLTDIQLADETAAAVVEAAVDSVTGEFNPGYGFVKSVYARMAEWLRSIGIDVAFTNTELQGMLVLSMKNLQAGARTQGGGSSVVMSAKAERTKNQPNDNAPRSLSPSRTPLYEAVRQLSRLDKSFQLGSSDAKGLDVIASEMQDSKRLDRKFTFDTGTELHQGTRKPTLTLRVAGADGTSQKLLDIFEANGSTPFVVIGNSALGKQVGGARAYQIAFAWAHNNGKTMRPDPAGLTVINRLRRTEAMISSALRFGTTKHLEPHQDQYVGMTTQAQERGIEPEDTHFSGRPDIYAELETLKSNLWTKGDDAGSIQTNVDNLLKAAAQLARIREPGIRTLEIVDGKLQKRGVDGAVSLADAATSVENETVNLAGVSVTPSVSGVGRYTMLRSVLVSSVGRAIRQLDNAQAGRNGQDGGVGSIRDVEAVRAIRSVIGQMDGSENELYAGILYAKSKTAVDQADPESIQSALQESEPTAPDSGGARTAQTDTPAFRKWFGNSKAVDAEGKPLVVYHGTDQSFDEFQGSAYFTPEPKDASDYSNIMTAGTDERAANVMPVYLSLQKPKIIKTYATRSDIDDARKSGKFDGVVVTDVGGGKLNHYITFRPTQIKSAIGNNGNFDPFNNSILQARGIPPGAAKVKPKLVDGYAPSGRRTISKVVADYVPGLGLDSTGRVQLEVAAKMKDFLAEKSSPWWERLGLKAQTPELRRQIRKMKLVVQDAQDTAVSVAREAQKLSTAERDMVSDIIEQELATGILPPTHALQLAQTISSTMEAQSDELVRLGMLTKDASDKWRGKYLPRYYKSKMADLVPDAWSTALRGINGRPNAMKGIRGNHLKRRGMTLLVPETELGNYTALGWSLDDSGYTPSINGDEKVPVWRDFNKSERENMGEIRDVSFRFVMGYMESQKDIALGTMFEGIAADPALSMAREQQGFEVMVPDTTVQGTGTKRYGRLAGRFVSNNTMSHLSQIEEAQSDVFRLYKEGMGIWKEGKTVLNPVSHTNNIVSNLTMAHLAGVSYHRVDKYISAIADFARVSPKLKEARDAGLFLGTVSDEDLKNLLPKELRDLAIKEESIGRKIGRNAFNLMALGLRRPLGAAYQGEDLFFRYLIWKDVTARGMDGDEAIDYAQKYIFTYDDLPKTARKIRDFAIPFFSYAYKSIPTLLSTAVTHPLRMGAPAAALWAYQAAMYAMLAGDDDEDWLDALNITANSKERRDKAIAQREEEYRLLPQWQKGTTALGTPKVLRMGKDEATGQPLFIDVSRMVPGGDMFDVSPNSGGVPFFQNLTPSHPLLTTFIAMFGNKDLYFGKEITDSNDTKGEATEKRLSWLYKQMAPAIAVNNYHWDRIMGMAANMNGGELPYVPDVLGGDATGIGRDGNAIQPKYAIPQTFGIKIRPTDLSMAETFEGFDKNKKVMEIDAELSKLLKQNQSGVLADRSYDKAKELADTKKARLRDGLTVDGESRNP